MNFVFIVIYLLHVIILSNSIDIECSFGTSTWPTASIYCCFVQNDLNITTRELAAIESLSGSHDRIGYDNNDVLAISAREKAVHYFPRKMNKFFGNLTGISFYKCGMKEIHQSDLKPFPELIYLYLGFNDIKILKRGLFDFNPKLLAFWISDNNIFYIENGIFDHLNQLTTLWLSMNPCIDMDAKNNVSKVKQIITEAERNCHNDEHLEIDRKLNGIEKKLRAGIFKDFSEKIEQIENSENAIFFKNQINDLLKFYNQSLSTEKYENSSGEDSVLESNSNQTKMIPKSVLINMNSGICPTNNQSSQLLIKSKEKPENFEKPTKNISQDIKNFSSNQTTSKYDSYELVNGRISNLETSVSSIVQSMEDSINNLSARIENLEKVMNNFIVRNMEMMENIKRELHVVQNDIEYIKTTNQKID